MDRFQELVPFFGGAWQALFRASVQRRHPMRTPVLGTSDGDKLNLRTVVLRHTDTKERKLRLFSDHRAKKIRELIVNPSFSMVFYDPKKMLQITTKGEVTIHHRDELTKKLWNGLPIKARKDYLSPKAPGTPVSTPENSLPEGWEDDPAFVEAGYINFTVLTCHVHFLDCLQLHREGHVRAQFRMVQGQEEWDKQWVTP